MNKAVLIPRLTVGGIRKNASSYVPYLLITVFSIFTFFIFSAICDNAIIMTLPRAMYVLALMQIGRVLLGIILAPVLFETNKFLVKQRKGELGLYNVLGLDRKYITLLMLLESVIIYVTTLLAGIGIGCIFSKLIFLILLNMAGLPVEASFTISMTSIVTTAIYFGVLVIFNLGYNLWQVFKAKPIEMMKESKKGEKQIKGLRIKSILGFLILGAGYYLALHTEVDSGIFVKFFLDVFLVVIGTRILFSTGSITILNKLKKTKSIYYQKNNFVTISGMLYRMKRNAQNLSNICIFSTMIMITLIFTVSVFFGKNESMRFNYPLDITCKFSAAAFQKEDELEQAISDIAAKNGVTIEERHGFHYQSTTVIKEGTSLRLKREDDDPYMRDDSIRMLSLNDFNACEGRNETLKPDEVLVYSTQVNFPGDEITVGDKRFKIKEHLTHFSFERKEERNLGQIWYYIVFQDSTVVSQVAKQLGSPEVQELYYLKGMNLVGEEEAKRAFAAELKTWCKEQPGFNQMENVQDWAEESESMIGGLLFLGIFFGIVFTACMVLMMYYKQLSEGYEDQRSFKIFKQVGMSNAEIKGNIKRQILLVFFIPLVMAAIHTLVAIHVVINLLAVILLFNKPLIIGSSLAVIFVFAIIYVISYLLTSRAYYRIVR